MVTLRFDTGPTGFLAWLLAGSPASLAKGKVMTRIFPSMFTGLLVAASVVQAGESATKNTVFKTDGGEAWTVSIKPTAKVAKAAPKSFPVPGPVDASLVLAQDQQPAGTSPQLPPAPAIENRESGVREAFGVTVAPDPRSDVEQLGRRYAQAYRAIPFNRAEYDANPSYRHEAAMELVFGQMRPTTIVKQMGGAPAADEPVYNPYQPYLPSAMDLWPWRALPYRNPTFDPCFVAPTVVPNGCYFPGY
ncbi:hypothetical protein AYO47_03045 [Planctomyces sp. SCGC AG-212-M04]|nr:hypothetical protein AYO47_03045 [Planctomyces sp. SCGC AG-212-M04]